MKTHIPICRLGAPYRSLIQTEVIDAQTGKVRAVLSLANAGLIRRDVRSIAKGRYALRRMSSQQILDICAQAGELFLHDTLPLDDNGATQTPQQYVDALSATSGLPHVLCRQNMQKIYTALTQMTTILRGLTRGLDLSAVDNGFGRHNGVTVSYLAATDALGVVLPSNSPGVNSIWLPAVGLKIPVVLKPGSTEPWTPLRIIRALVAAGYPDTALGFYPTDHEGAAAILDTCNRSILFGDDATIRAHAGNPNVQLHGSGRSKVVLGPDVVDQWPDLLDVLVASILDNGGRSCINASCIIAPRHADEIAEALARRLATINPRLPDDDDAMLAAFVNPAICTAINNTIERGLQVPGAVEVTEQFRTGTRHQTVNGLSYLQPTVVRCENLQHPLGNTEFLFPFAGVIEMSMEDALRSIGPTLATTVITNDAELKQRFIGCRHIDRLNLGAIPTTRVDWDQPHEGNLFELLYRRRAIQHEF